MSKKKKIEEELGHELGYLYSNAAFLSQIKDELWRYHPSNPDFVNPITEYKNVVKQLEQLDVEIIVLEDKISILNQLD